MQIQTEQRCQGLAQDARWLAGTARAGPFGMSATRVWRYPGGAASAARSGSPSSSDARCFRSRPPHTPPAPPLSWWAAPSPNSSCTCSSVRPAGGGTAGSFQEGGGGASSAPRLQPAGMLAVSPCTGLVQGGECRPFGCMKGRGVIGGQPALGRDPPWPAFRVPAWLRRVTAPRPLADHHGAGPAAHPGLPVCTPARPRRPPPPPPHRLSLAGRPMSRQSRRRRRRRTGRRRRSRPAAR